MKNWWFNLTDNERRLLRIGVVLIAMALFWVAVYQPVTRYIAQQAETKQRLTGQLQQMQRMVASMGTQARTQVQPIPVGMTLSSWVDGQLRLLNLQDKVNRTEPIDANSLTVWFQGVSFDQVIDWVHQLAHDHGVAVDLMDVNVVDASLGLTNIRMRLVK
ncbi:type II secretion system protein GspM [Marinicella meishanensis]|uniref:type II secretion system protein GspM n=1 Tax=Marinicella meishanensis TaxID=2873263 RepID=UPI001CBB2142|nr:type II secretion system protein GspM [Marinicella sp. NBU2979]